MRETIRQLVLEDPRAMTAAYMLVAATTYLVEVGAKDAVGPATGP